MGGIKELIIEGTKDALAWEQGVIAEQLGLNPDNLKITGSYQNANNLLYLDNSNLPGSVSKDNTPKAYQVQPVKFKP